MSIWKPVNDRIVRASRDTNTEIIGLLLGRLEDDAIIIEDSITGNFSAEPNRVTLPSVTLAKIADDLVSGRVKGNIVGWYHSHTEGGLFFSDIDTQTQRKLQQFSSLITGMVVDVVTGDVGYFRVDPQTGKTIRILDEKVRLYTEPSEAIPPEMRARARIRPAPTIEVRAQPSQPKQPAQRLIISIILIALVASSALLAVLFYRGVPAGPQLTINHNPIPNATIGTPIEVKANVTGPVRNVTLHYAPAGAASFIEVEMSSPAPGQYLSLIPGEQVTGTLSYYIKASDTAGNQVSTSTYHIVVADFNLLTQNKAFVVYRTKSTVSELTLISINGFSQQVSVTATGFPQGLTVAFSPNPAPAGTTRINMNVAAGDNTPNGTFSVAVAATYRPPESPPLARQTTVMITVADLDLQVSPSSRTLTAGTSTSYTLTVTIQRGFVDPVKISVAGLPQGATYQLITSSSTILGGGPGTVTITLQITTTTSVKSGTYNLTIDAAGGGLVHSQTVQFIVR